MSSSIKNPVEPDRQGKSNPSPRSNPVCLEVGVTLRSLPSEAGNPAQPIREELRTVIVFDNGAVLRSSNNLPSGLTLILSNASGRDVVCRVVSGRSMPSVKGYAEIEFMEPVKDFWGIHQETTSAAPAAPSAQAAPPPPAPGTRTTTPSAVRTPTSTTSPVAAPPVQRTFPDSPAWPTVPVSIEPSPTLPGIPTLPSAPTTPNTGLTGTLEFDEFPGPMSDSFLSVATREPKTGPAVPSSTSAAPATIGTNGKLVSEKATPLYNHVPVTGSTSVADWSTPAAEQVATKSASPALSDSSSQAAPSSSARDFMSKGLMAYDQPTEAAGAPSKRTPLILGAAAVVFVAICGVVLFTHHGSSPTPVATSPVSQPVPSQSAPAKSAPAPVQTARQAETPAPTQVESKPEAQPIAATSAVPAATVRPIPAAEISDATISASRSDSRSAREQDKPAAVTKQSDSASSKRPTLSNLKIGAPIAPKNHLGNGADVAAPTTEIASAEMPEGAGSANLLTSSGRTANAPLAPVSVTAPPPPVQSVTDPKLISSTRPLYPQTARQANIEGSVTLVIYIDQNGKVFSARAVSGPVMLRAAAEESVKQWKYSPALEGGKPAQSHTVVKVDFKLN